jgi:bisphosphoglycerate-dependent phosphoglycerate mutase
MNNDYTFVRHGQTYWNKNGIMHGQYDIPLNDTGVKQAKKISNELKNEQVEALFSGLILGTYNLGHYKKTEAHPFLTNDFVFQYIAKENLAEIILKGIKIE